MPWLTCRYCKTQYWTNAYNYESFYGRTHLSHIKAFCIQTKPSNSNITHATWETTLEA